MKSLIILLVLCTASLFAAENDTFAYYHIVREIKASNSTVVLEDQSEWRIGWWYTGSIKSWKSGDRLKISHHEKYSNNMKLENIDHPSSAWGTIQIAPAKQLAETIKRVPNSVNFAENYKKVILNSGWVLFSEKQQAQGWHARDTIFILHENNGYRIWNMTAKTLSIGWQIIDNEKMRNQTTKIVFDNVLTLDTRLSKRVLGQPEAVSAVTTAIWNYAAGLADPKQPIRVFLFLGPTGVGKTELAKVLTQELYQSSLHLQRFEMSHFTEPHSLARLIGAPPGYVNHEEGGQLTEALKAMPQSVVLLDEVEKAHHSVRKVFLPVFDEGYITDAKWEAIPCTDSIFIMTSNLCASQVLDLYQEGHSPEKILQIIEPKLIEELSPELYARCEPIVFHPLGKETVSLLVDMMLGDVKERIKQAKSTELVFDESVKHYLIQNGYHPKLGARPLKSLIQKKVISTISYYLLKENIPGNSKVTLYCTDNDEWQITWEPLTL